MTYSVEISRTNPTCFLFLIDQSGSMSDRFGRQPELRKADGVADAINKLLANLIIKSTKSEGVRDYFHIGVIGYGLQVAPALGGALSGRPLVPISEALELARQTVADFIGRVPTCYPPLVVNITDGEANSDPDSAAAAIRGLSCNDGDVLLFNLHVSSQPVAAIEFPDSEAALPDQFEKQLFRMSSVLPPVMCAAAKQQEFRVSDNSRGFVFNADLVSVIQFLDIGTKVAQNAR
jgi:hypothetical protein